jgi:hypothetical protein
MRLIFGVFHLILMLLRDKRRWRASRADGCLFFPRQRSVGPKPIVDMLLVRLFVIIIVIQRGRPRVSGLRSPLSRPTVTR